MGWTWVPEHGPNCGSETSASQVLPSGLPALEDASGRAPQTAPAIHQPWSPWARSPATQELPGRPPHQGIRRVNVPVQIIATPTATSSALPADQTAVRAMPTEPLSVSNSWSAGAVMPESLLARIESVVSEMERDMGAERKLGSGKEEAEASKVSVDLLGQRLQALEKQREAAELRAAQLAELRMIVGRGRHGSHSISEDSLALRRKGRLGKEDGDGSVGESHISTVLTGSEAEDGADAQAEATLTELEAHFQLERNQLGLSESANLGFHERLQQVMQAMLHKDHLAEEHSEQQRFAAEAARREQQATEADLQALEKHSETVLADCRALQARVKELEETCSGSGYRHAKRACELEEKLKAADGLEQELRSDLEEVSKQLELTRAKEAALQEELAASQAECQHLIAKGSAERDRLKALERDHEDMIASHSRQQQLLKQQVVDLQKELAETQEREQLHARSHGELKGASAGLEGQLAHVQQRATESAQLHAEAQLELRVMEQRLSEAESAKSDHQKRHTLVHSQFQDMEQELEKAKVAQQNAQEEVAELCERIDALEVELREAHEAEQRLSKQAAAASQASSEQIECLETLLAEEQQARAEMERLHDENSQVHKSSASELEMQIEDLKADLGSERATSQALREKLQEAQELGEQIRIDAEDALRKQDEARKKVEDLAEERYHDLREHVASLEGMLEKERAKDLLKLRTVSVASSDLAAPRDRKLSVASSDIDDLPPRQRAILEQVEQQGWDSVSWRDGYTMLHWAASKGKVDLLRRLLPLNGDPDAVDKFDRTALQCAEEAHHSEAAEFLRRHTRPKTEKLVRSSKKHQTAFPATTSTSAYVSSVAGRRPSEPTLEQMRSQSKGTELPELYLPVLDEIQRIGWSNMKWAHGFTLLHWAAKNNNPELIERFLSEGADPLQEDQFGRTALDYARDSGSASVVAAFAKHGAGPVQKRSIDLRNLDKAKE